STPQRLGLLPFPAFARNGSGEFGNEMPVPFDRNPLYRTAAVAEPERGVAVVTNSVASRTARPRGVGSDILYGTTTRVPAIGASQISMSCWAARYLIAGRSGTWPATGTNRTPHTATGP